MLRHTRLLLAGVVSAALVLMTPVASNAASSARHTYVVLTGGATSLKLDDGTAAVLTANKISVAPVSEAKVTDRGISFPIQGGVVKAGSLAGTIKHRGGLVFTAGGKQLVIRDFQINTKRGVLTGYVEQLGQRVPVLDLNLKRITVRVGGGHVVIRNVKATLDGTAAGALNSYFGTSLFTAGLTIGTARVDARAKILR